MARGALLDSGNNLDVAIQRLTGLRLQSDDVTAAATSLSQQPQRHPTAQSLEGKLLGIRLLGRTLQQGSIQSLYYR